MNALASIDYQITERTDDTGVVKRVMVKGYPVKPQDRNVKGIYAVREVGQYNWVVDNVDTGFRVCAAPTRNGVLDFFNQLVQEKGAAGFARRIKKARKKLESCVVLS